MGDKHKHTNSLDIGSLKHNLNRMQNKLKPSKAKSPSIEKEVKMDDSPHKMGDAGHKDEPVIHS